MLIMAKGLTREINFAKVRKLIINGSVDKLHKQAPNIKDSIEDRTLQGKDVNMKSFKPYSPSYARRKGGDVDLYVKGHMLGAMTYDKEKWGLHFRFSSKRQTDKAVWNSKTRKFFGIDSKMVKYLKKQIGKL